MDKIKIPDYGFFGHKFEYENVESFPKEKEKVLQWLVAPIGPTQIKFDSFDLFEDGLGLLEPVVLRKNEVKLSSDKDKEKFCEKYNKLNFKLVQLYAKLEGIPFNIAVHLDEDNIPSELYIAAPREDFDFKTIEELWGIK